MSELNKPPGALERLIMSIPKTELHLHIEGAIPLEVLFSFIQREGGEPSIKTVDDLQKRFTYTDFAHFIKTWIWKNTFITEERDFEDIAYSVLRNLKTQNVKYVEAFYSPGDYQRQHLSPQGITEHLIRGKDRAYRDFGIQCELIADIVRNDGPEAGMQRVEEVTPYLERVSLALD